MSDKEKAVLFKLASDCYQLGVQDAIIGLTIPKLDVMQETKDQAIEAFEKVRKRVYAAMEELKQ